MKKLILMVFLCLNAFGEEKLEIDRNIVNLITDEDSYLFDIKDVLVLKKTNIDYPNRTFYSISFRVGGGFNIDYSEPETHKKLIELFKAYNNQ